MINAVKENVKMFLLCVFVVQIAYIQYCYSWLYSYKALFVTYFNYIHFEKSYFTADTAGSIIEHSLYCI